MNDYLNGGITIVFAVLAVMMFVRYSRIRGKVLVADQQWSAIRIAFVAIAILTFATMFSSQNSVLDYCRIGATVFAVTAYMVCRDGVGEEGIVSAGKLFPWNEVRAWDYEERKNVVAMFFQVDSQNAKKPDEYSTKELDFANKDKEVLMKFMKMNQNRKYTRMKRKK
jgi:hypothetical protein